MRKMTKGNIEIEIMRFIQQNFHDLNFEGVLKGKEIIGISKDGNSVTLQSEYERKGTYEFNGNIMIALKINENDYVEGPYLIFGYAEINEINEKPEINIVREIFVQKTF